MAHAIALAATSIGGMAISADTSCGREYHAGASAAAAVQAALAAEAGFTGELSVLEHPRGFLAAMGGQAIEDITRDLGASWDIVTDMAIKLMPGAHPFHATAEAASDAARIGKVDPQDIKEVFISSAVQWTKFKGEPHPRNLVDAAHSLYYFVAASIVDGRFSWQHMDERKMTDPAIAALQEKIVFDPDPAAAAGSFSASARWDGRHPHERRRRISQHLQVAAWLGAARRRVGGCRGQVSRARRRWPVLRRAVSTRASRSSAVSRRRIQ